MGASYNLLICPSHQHLVMRPVWVRRADGGQWVHLASVADAVAHVKRNGTEISFTRTSPGRQTKGVPARDGSSLLKMRSHIHPLSPMPLRAVHQRWSLPSSTLSLLSPHVPAVATNYSGISSPARIVITRFISCARSTVIALNAHAVCAINHTGLTCGHAKHASTWCIRHVQCTSPSVWRSYAKYAHRGPGHGSTHRLPRGRSVGSEPNGQPVAHGCNMPMG